MVQPGKAKGHRVCSGPDSLPEDALQEGWDGLRDLQASTETSLSTGKEWESIEEEAQNCSGALGNPGVDWEEKESGFLERPRNSASCGPSWVFKWVPSRVRIYSF